MTGYLYSNIKTRAAAVAFAGLMSATPMDQGAVPSPAGPYKHDYTYYAGRYRAAQIPSAMPMASREDPPPPKSEGQTSFARAPQRAAQSAYGGLLSPSRIDLSPPFIPAIVPDFARAVQRTANAAYDPAVVTHAPDVPSSNPVPTSLTHLARGNQPRLALAAQVTSPPPDPGRYSFPQVGKNWVCGIVRIAAYALNVGPQYEAATVSQAGPHKKDYLYFRTSSPTTGMSVVPPPMDLGQDPCIQTVEVPDFARGSPRAGGDAYRPSASPTPPDLGLDLMSVCDLESIPDRQPNTTAHPAYAWITPPPVDQGLYTALPPVKTIFPDFARGHQPRLANYAIQVPPPGEIAPPLPVVRSTPDFARSADRAAREAYRSLLSPTPPDGSTMPTPVVWPDHAREMRRAGSDAYRAFYGLNITLDSADLNPSFASFPNHSRGPQYAAAVAYCALSTQTPGDAGVLPILAQYPDVVRGDVFRADAYRLIVPAMPDGGIFQYPVVPPSYPSWTPPHRRTAAYRLQVSAPISGETTPISPSPFKAKWKASVDSTKAKFSDVGSLLSAYIANPSLVPWVPISQLSSHTFGDGSLVLVANPVRGGGYDMAVGTVDSVDPGTPDAIWLDSYSLFCVIAPSPSVASPFKAKWNTKTS